MKHLNIKITGNVQGVFFRGSAQKKAREMDIGGFARNETDDSLYIEAEGDEKLLNSFINWCENGPPTAKVSDISIKEGKIIGFKDFETH